MTAEPPEMLEVYTPAGQPTGVVKPRGAIHHDGDWHLAAFVWMFDPAGRVLLQQRAPEKDTWPGRWDASVAGHVSAGESTAAAATREIAEELGLDVAAGALVAAGAHAEEHVHPRGLVDREHHAVFLLPIAPRLDACAPGPEVTAIGFVPLAALAAHARGESHALPIETGAGSLLLRRDDLVPYAPAYLARVVAAIGARVRRQ